MLNFRNVVALVHRPIRPKRVRRGGVPAVEGGPNGRVSRQTAGPVPSEHVAHVAAGGRVGGGRGELGGATPEKDRDAEGGNL